MLLKPGFLTGCSHFMLDHHLLVQVPLSSSVSEPEMPSDRKDHTASLKQQQKANYRSVISVLWISLAVKVGVWSQRPVQGIMCQPACLNFGPSEPRNTLIILCKTWPFDSGKQRQKRKLLCNQASSCWAEESRNWELLQTGIALKNTNRQNFMVASNFHVCHHLPAEFI